MSHSPADDEVVEHSRVELVQNADHAVAFVDIRVQGRLSYTTRYGGEYIHMHAQMTDIEVVTGYGSHNRTHLSHMLQHEPRDVKRHHCEREVL